MKITIRSALKTQHAIAAIVAIGLVLLALADGGYYPRAIAIVALGTWWIALVPLVLGLWPRDRVPRSALAAGAALCALAIYTAFSLGWSGDSGKGFPEVVRTAGYAGLFAVVVLASRRGEGRAWIAGIAIGATTIALLAVAGRCQPSLFEGGTVELANSLPSARSRLSFPVGYWNGLATITAVAIVTLAWFGANGGRRWTRSLSVALVPPAALALFLTSSRGGVAAALAGIAVVAAIGPRRSRTAIAIAIAAVASIGLIVLAASKDAFTDGLAGATAASQGDQMMVLTLLAALAAGLVALALDRPAARVRVPAWAGWTAVAAIAIVIAAAIAVADPVERFDEFRQPPAVDGSDPAAGVSHLASGAGSGRWQFWDAAASAFRSAPLSGIGATGYENWWNLHGSLPLAIRDAHSWPIEAFAELGLIGGLLGFGFVAAVVFATGRRLSAGPSEDSLAATGAAAGVFAAVLLAAAIDWLWELPAVFAYLVLAAGILCGACLEPGDAAGRSREGRFGWGIATICFALASIWVAGVLLLAEGKLAQSHEAVDDRRLADAAQDAADAATIEPWAAAPRLQLALVRELDGDLRGARRELTEAIDRAPGDWALWVVAARIDLGLGSVDRARADLAEARRLNPKAAALLQSQAAAGGRADR